MDFTGVCEGWPRSLMTCCFDVEVKVILKISLDQNFGAMNGLLKLAKREPGKKRAYARNKISHCLFTELS